MIPVAPPEALPDCGHPDWQVGCPRCFLELKGLAKGNIQATTAEAQMEGAVLMNWHVIMVVADMEKQMIPLLQSLELDKVRLAKELIANLQALRRYCIQLGAVPGRMEAALQSAAAIAKEVDQLVRSEETALAKSSLVITDAA